MKYLIIYTALYFISLYFIFKDLEEIKRTTNYILAHELYVVFCVLIGLFLIGLVDVYTEIKRFIKKVSIVIFANLLLWKLKRKYKIK